MSHALVSRNEDIRRLVEKGYAVAFDANHYLVVRDIPYLDSERKLRWGAFVSNFTDRGEDLIEQVNHEIWFAGGVPHGLDGTPIANLAGGPATLPLSEDSKDVVVQRSFSNKPKDTGKFRDFFHKVESYTAIIAGPAMGLHGVSPLTFRVVEAKTSDSPFKFRDTLSSRAEIGDLAARFKHDVVAIIGLGGTGAYLLDLLVKTPVREVRGFDHDLYHVHNAYRSPGRLEDPGELNTPKASVYSGRYENFRHGLVLKRAFIDASTGSELDGVTFAFVSVDKGSARAGIVEVLIDKKIPFIDVGMGLRRKNGPLDGMIRSTYFDPASARATRDQGLVELADHPDDEYRVQIQTAELNALNACITVLRFKQLRGFYHHSGSPDHLLLEVGSLKTLGHAQA